MMESGPARRNRRPHKAFPNGNDTAPDATEAKMAATNGTDGSHTTDRTNGEASEHIVRAAPRRKAAQAAQAASTAASTVANAAKETGAAAAKTVRSVKRRTREAIAAEIRDTAEQVVDTQRAKVIRRVQNVADTLRDTATKFERQNIAPLAEYAERAAQEVEHWSARVRTKSLNDITADAAAVVRRQPVLFLAGAAGIGFLLGRFLKATDRGDL